MRNEQDLRQKNDNLSPPQRHRGAERTSTGGGHSQPSAQWQSYEGTQKTDPHGRAPYNGDYLAYDLDAFSANRPRQSREERSKAQSGRTQRAPSREARETPTSVQRPQRARSDRAQQASAPQSSGRGMTPAHTAPRNAPKKSAQQYSNREEQRQAQNARRIKKLKRRRRFTIITVAILALVVAVVLCCTVFFKVNKIEIKGVTFYSQDQVLSQLGIQPGDNMITINKKEKQDYLASRLPYVKSATIEFALPSTVRVSIKENKASYYVPADDGTFALLDDRLKVLSQGEKEVPPDLASLEGTVFETIAVSKKAIMKDAKLQQALDDVLAAIVEVEFSKVTSIQVINQATTFVTYDNRIKLKLGTATGLVKKLTVAKASIEDPKEDNILMQSTTKGTLDLTTEKRAYFTMES